MSVENKVFYKSAADMAEIPDNSIGIVVTSPPYFNIKDYSKDGKQEANHSVSLEGDMGACVDYNNYLDELCKVWRECERVLKPNGKLCINVPLLPMKRADYTTHHNRHIFDIQSGIQQSILNKTNMFLMDVYIWNRLNPTKALMFGSYPYPTNFYAQNTTEFITIYVKDGKPLGDITAENKEASKLTQEQWVNYTKQIWDLPIPSRGDAAYGIHSAIMPEGIAHRCISLYSYAGDIVLDPFTGSGTTLKVAAGLGRRYVGYELYDSYKKIINYKMNEGSQQELLG